MEEEGRVGAGCLNITCLSFDKILYVAARNKKLISTKIPAMVKLDNSSLCLFDNNSVVMRFILSCTSVRRGFIIRLISSKKKYVYFLLLNENIEK